VGELKKGQTNSIFGPEARGVPENNSNLEAVKFWQRFFLANNSQKLFQNM
jgi:hypothetical protein